MLLDFHYRENGFKATADYSRRSCIAVVSLGSPSPRIEYFGYSKFANTFGRLHTATNHALVTRYGEYDNTVDRRYGADELLILDYTNGDSKSHFSFSFGVGAYVPGEMAIDINLSKNWVVIARETRSGWENIPTVVAHIYDLADGEEVASSILENVPSLNAISFLLPHNSLLQLITLGMITCSLFTPVSCQASPSDHLYINGESRSHSREKIDPSLSRSRRN